MRMRDLQLARGQGEGRPGPAIGHIPVLENDSSSILLHKHPLIFIAGSSTVIFFSFLKNVTVYCNIFHICLISAQKYLLILPVSL